MLHLYEKYTNLSMETERIRYIYCITNLVNGKTYIGQCTLTEGRTFETDTYRGSGKLLWRAYEKYGKENFKRTCIIQGHFSKEQINRFERCMIACQRLCGKAEYNLADGGEGGNTSRFIDYKSNEYKNNVKKGTIEGRIKHYGSLENYKMHQKQIAQQNLTKDLNYYTSKGMTGKHFSEEAKQKMRESHLGEKNPQYGKKQSEETKHKKREARQKSHDELFTRIKAYLSASSFSPCTKTFGEIGKKFGVSYKTVERCYKEMLNI